MPTTVHSTLPTYEELFQENIRLYGVLEINAILSATLRLDIILNTLLDKAKEVCKAQASSIMRLDEEKQELFFHIIKGHESEALLGVRLKLGEGISGWVALNRQPVLVEDCTKDARFYRKADQKSSFITKSMMCVPLMVKERSIGTIQVLNRVDEKPFTTNDLRIFQVLANQAAIAIENARLHEMATVDAMTGLYMKDYFMARLEEEYNRSKRTGNPLSLLMSDIDLFKKVNDTYGHQGGDLALVALAKIIHETIANIANPLDMAGRYGGEEFCILLPGRDVEDAFEIGEMIRKNIETRDIPIENKKAKITISIGYTTFPFHDRYIKNAEDFIKLADSALYICKAKGRNCVSLYEDKDKNLFLKS